ncbi:hypothetical protein SSYRP_v1c04040 [Spiroplasma syrphidicola EA-1]|uniref:Uncharacterized protein n=1 Tax=Spiroplasma syrphidicola EA-1 TaxID=1276229 RepID=R4U3K9_9MOLU|nr:hypothetical protein [Spiroplasma syrphidicola]AGM25997.1 hypothetical protein SSYRP_v1c04040 [Spiroplasma syrphidicola EA-1]
MAVKKTVAQAPTASVSDLINQIINEGSDLQTKEEVQAIRQKQLHEEWVKKNNEACILEAKKWEARIAAAKEREKKIAAKKAELDKVDVEKIAKLEEQQKQEIIKNNALYEERTKKQIKMSNIARVKNAMRARKSILSKESWEKEAQKWEKLLDQVSR